MESTGHKSRDEEMTKKLYAKNAERNTGHPMYTTIENATIAMVQVRSQSNTDA